MAELGCGCVAGWEVDAETSGGFVAVSVGREKGSAGFVSGMGTSSEAKPGMTFGESACAKVIGGMIRGSKTSSAVISRTTSRPRCWAARITGMRGEEESAAAILWASRALGTQRAPSFGAHRRPVRQAELLDTMTRIFERVPLPSSSKENLEANEIGYPSARGVVFWLPKRSSCCGEVRNRSRRSTVDSGYRSCTSFRIRKSRIFAVATRLAKV